MDERAGLPDGWETQLDEMGRRFYINHVNQTTSWDRPQAPAAHSGSLEGNDREYGTPTQLATEFLIKGYALILASSFSPS